MGLTGSQPYQTMSRKFTISKYFITGTTKAYYLRMLGEIFIEVHVTKERKWPAAAILKAVMCSLFQIMKATERSSKGIRQFVAPKFQTSTDKRKQIAKRKFEAKQPYPLHTTAPKESQLPFLAAESVRGWNFMRHNINLDS